jgi:hypothetical protein
MSLKPNSLPPLDIHTTHALSPKGSRSISNIPLRFLILIQILREKYFGHVGHVLPKFFFDVTGGKPIAVLLQSISGVSAINPLVAFYDIHGGSREVIFFYFVPDTTRVHLIPIL